MTSDPTVFIVDDDAVVRDAGKTLLVTQGFNTETFASAEDFLARFDPSRPGCLLLDLRMPGMDGLTLQQELQRLNISIPIIFFTGNADVQSAVTGLTNGAVGFMEKPIQPAALLSAIKQAIHRDRQTRQQNERFAEIQARLDTLTDREREVLDRVVAGKPTKAIAAELGTAENTVKNQRSSILAKMEADCVADLVRMAVMAATDRDSVTG
jgi:RNA polymerase sigma factor (sigma-70 family)